MKIEIKPATVKRIEKMGGTLTDVAINKAIDTVTGKISSKTRRLHLDEFKTYQSNNQWKGY